MMRSMRRAAGILGASVCLGGITGCLGKKDAAFEQIAAPDQTIGQFSIAPDNSILAIGGTVQLTASALSLTGSPLTTLDSVVYTLSAPGDTTLVRLNTSGLVTGRATTAANGVVRINGVAFRQSSYNADQVLVSITPTAVSGLTLSIQPPPTDSTKLAINTNKTITPIFRNPTTGQTLTGIGLQYAVQPKDAARVAVTNGSWFLLTSQNLNAVTFHNNQCLNGLLPNVIYSCVPNGSAWIYANVNAYGTLLQDSVQYTFTWPYTSRVQVQKSTENGVTTLGIVKIVNSGLAVSGGSIPDMTIAPSGTVTFANGQAAADALTVAFTFETPEAATVATPPSVFGGTTGNTTALAGGQVATRRFLTPGTYRYSYVTGGGQVPWSGQTASGAIVVK